MIGDRYLMPVENHLVEVVVRDVRDGILVLVQTTSRGFGAATMLVRADILEPVNTTGTGVAAAAA